MMAVHAQQAGDELVVAVKPKALMRSDANTQSKMVAAVPVGAAVKVIAVSTSTEQVMNLEGKWLQVEHKGKTGWIFGPLLKRAADNHTVRILNGTIILDDPAAVASTDLTQLAESVAATDVELKVVTTAPDAWRQCSGTLMLRRAGKLQSGKNDFSCGGVSATSSFRVAEWQIISGRLYFTAQKSSTEVCHSDNCQETSKTTKTTLEFRNVKLTAPGKFTADF